MALLMQSEIVEFGGRQYVRKDELLPLRRQVAQSSGELVIAQRMGAEGEPATINALDNLKSSNIEPDDEAAWELFAVQQRESRAHRPDLFLRGCDIAVPAIIGTVISPGQTQSYFEIDSRLGEEPFTRIALDDARQAVESLIQYQLHLLVEFP